MEWWRNLSESERALERRTWPEGLVADFEERAAIKQANGIARVQAEAEAFVEVLESEYARRDAETRRSSEEAAARREAARVRGKSNS